MPRRVDYQPPGSCGSACAAGFVTVSVYVLLTVPLTTFTVTVFSPSAQVSVYLPSPPAEIAVVPSFTSSVAPLSSATAVSLLLLSVVVAVYAVVPAANVGVRVKLPSLS